jgi:hypothetical protein
MRWLALCSALAASAWSAPAYAEPPSREQSPLGSVSSPYAPAVRQHYYELLARSPGKAFLWELALPGAGHVYAGFYVQAAVAASLSVAGAGLWIAGALRDNDELWWAGAATFSAGRAYGLVSAPISAALLNAAFRRQLGISARF